MYQKIFLSTSLLLLTFFASAKTKHTACHLLQKSDYRISLFNAGIGMPPHFVNGRIHPGLELGLQKQLLKKVKNSYIDYNILGGYFAQQSLQRSLYLKPGIGYHIYISKHFSVRPVLNVSLMGVQQINKEFEKNDNGEYEQASRNRFQVMPALGLEAAYTFLKRKNMHYAAMLGYQFGTQLPFSSISSILPINQLHIGMLLKKSN